MTKASHEKRNKQFIVIGRHSNPFRVGEQIRSAPPFRYLRFDFRKPGLRLPPKTISIKICQQYGNCVGDGLAMIGLQGGFAALLNYKGNVSFSGEPVFPDAGTSANNNPISAGKFYVLSNSATEPSTGTSLGSELGFCIYVQTNSMFQCQLTHQLSAGALQVRVVISQQRPQASKLVAWALWRC